METINYGRIKVPLMLIFKGVYYLRKYFKNNIDSNVYWARSKTGFINNKLALKYLEHFNRFTKDIAKGYRMLIFNGYSSYLS